MSVQRQQHPDGRDDDASTERRSSSVEITVDRVDVELLRQQRNALLSLDTAATPPEIGGLVTMLDHMLDVAEGFTPS
jgi:hypothetical protein